MVSWSWRDLSKRTALKHFKKTHTSMSLFSSPGSSPKQVPTGSISVAAIVSVNLPYQLLIVSIKP